MADNIKLEEWIMDVFAPLDGPPCQSITVDFSDQGPETLEIISLAMEVFDRVVKHSKPCFDQRAADPECMIQARPTIVFVQANRLELFYTVMRRMFSEQCILVTYCPERRGEELGIDPGLCFQSSRQFMMRLRLNVRRFQRDHAFGRTVYLVPDTPTWRETIDVSRGLIDALR